MPALKEFLITQNLHEYYDDHGIPRGSGPIVLFDKFPYELQMYLWSEGLHIDDPDELEDCQVPLEFDDLKQGFDVPKTGSLFAWRPAVLPSVNGPAWPYPSRLLNSNS
jgi:hypothetical protein